MRKKSLLILAMVVALSMTTLIAATIYTTFNVGMTATVPVVVDATKVTIGIGSSTYHSGDSISLPWGQIQIGTNTQSLTITNNANVALVPAVSSTDLPSGWELSLSLPTDQTNVAAGGSATATLTLTVPSNATAGTYSWSASIEVTYG